MRTGGRSESPGDRPRSEAYDAFRERALRAGTRVYNPLCGKADMAGKQYLLDLTAAGLPVIPTADRAEDLDRLPAADRYVVKPRLGADSIGLRTPPAGRTSAAPDAVRRGPQVRHAGQCSVVPLSR
ncbi:hypothetical protein M2156_001885 [Streptomyces sp. SAI-149]|nr:hypothetical protein [Streptomyces sp. SAI-119]MDH6495666.1 hypothetical protein [Streptomyces sp. SAI-149]